MLDRLDGKPLKKEINPKLKAIGRFITREREKLGWSREYLAEKAELGYTSVERMERGESVYAYNLELVLNALGYTIGVVKKK